MSKVFVVSDTHFPFHNKKAYETMMKHIKAEKPTHVVQIGDLLDQYVFSKYSRSLEITPNTEIAEGLKLANNFWANVRKMLPKVNCIQVMGNHDMRIAKRISDQLPELEGVMKKVIKNDWYYFKGVKTLSGDRDYIEIDGVIYVHGWLSKSIDHAKHFNKPTVHGHRHRPTIEVDRPGLWSMDVGFLADEKSVPLNYTMSKLTRWTLACGVVDKGQPRLIFLK